MTRILGLTALALVVSGVLTLAWSGGGVEELLAEGRSAHSRGRLDEAAFTYRQAVMRDPFHADADFHVGVALYQLGKTKEAAGTLRRSLSKGSKDPMAQVMLALATSDVGESTEAYHQAILMEPSYGAADFDPDTVLLRRGLLPAKALRSDADAKRFASFSDAPSPPGQAIPSGDAPAADAEGRRLESEGRLYDAVAAYRRATSLAPDVPSYHRHLASALSALAAAENAKADSLTPKP